MSFYEPDDFSPAAFPEPSQTTDEKDKEQAASEADDYFASFAGQESFQEPGFDDFTAAGTSLFADEDISPAELQKAAAARRKALTQQAKAARQEAKTQQKAQARAAALAKNQGMIRTLASLMPQEETVQTAGSSRQHALLSIPPEGYQTDLFAPMDFTAGLEQAAALPRLRAGGAAADESSAAGPVGTEFSASAAGTENAAVPGVDFDSSEVRFGHIGTMDEAPLSAGRKSRSTSLNSSASGLGRQRSKGRRAGKGGREGSSGHGLESAVSSFGSAFAVSSSAAGAGSACRKGGRSGTGASRGGKKEKIDDLSQALNAALGYLAAREYTKRELFAKLKGRFSDRAAEAALKRCVEEGWQSDERYADMLYRHMEFQGYGAFKFKFEALKKGVPSAVIDKFVKEGKWHEIALSYLKRHFGSELQQYAGSAPDSAGLSSFIQDASSAQASKSAAALNSSPAAVELYADDVPELYSDYADQALDAELADDSADDVSFAGTERRSYYELKRKILLKMGRRGFKPAEILAALNLLSRDG